VRTRTPAGAGRVGEEPAPTGLGDASVIFLAMSRISLASWGRQDRTAPFLQEASSADRLESAKYQPIGVQDGQFRFEQIGTAISLPDRLGDTDRPPCDFKTPPPARKIPSETRMAAFVTLISAISKTSIDGSGVLCRGVHSGARQGSCRLNHAANG